MIPNHGHIVPGGVRQDLKMVRIGISCDVSPIREKESSVKQPRHYKDFMSVIEGLKTTIYSDRQQEFRCGLDSFQRCISGSLKFSKLGDELVYEDESSWIDKSYVQHVRLMERLIK